MKTEEQCKMKCHLMIILKDRYSLIVCETGNTPGARRELVDDQKFRKNN